MRYHFYIITLLIILSACGKKSSSSSSLYATTYEASPEGVQMELRDLFSSRDHIEQETTFIEAMFLRFKINPGKDKFRSIQIDRSIKNSICIQLMVSAGRSTSSIVDDCTHNTTNYNFEDYYDYYYKAYKPRSVTIINPFPGPSNVINQRYELYDALNIPANRVAKRTVTINGHTFQGYGIQIDLDSTQYKEFVIVPELPEEVNPILIYYSGDGSITALEGIKVI